MKKTLTLILVLLMLTGLVACSKDNTQTTETTESTTADGMVFHHYDENGNLVTEIVSTTRFQGTTDPMTQMSVVMPRDYIFTLDVKYQNNLQLFCTDNNFTSYTDDEQNGTVTFTMTATVYNNMLYEKRRQLNTGLIALIESDTYPYFRKYINNDDYTEMTVYVDKAEYEKGEFSAMLPYYVSDVCMHSYQIFTTATSYSCTVTVKDIETDEVIGESSRISIYNR